MSNDTKLSASQRAELEKPLNRAHVEERKLYGTSGPTLSYIAAHHAIREANRIFGYDGWTRRGLEMQLIQDEKKGDKYYVGYVAKVEVEAGDTVRHGWGFGQGIDKDLGGAHESAVKEAESDAMKRALMTFGDQFGLALYDKAQVNVVVDAPTKPSVPFEQERVYLNSIGFQETHYKRLKELAIPPQTLSELVFGARDSGMDDAENVLAHIGLTYKRN